MSENMNAATAVDPYNPKVSLKSLGNIVNPPSQCIPMIRTTDPKMEIML